ncbi:hypothetical protein FS837_003460 [Tulasnella sp. UAMH 9824]|nr:hypothetical protein FS837_003460 [Tulasnella sp. UAMH 9824]
MPWCSRTNFFLKTKAAVKEEESQRTITPEREAALARRAELQARLAALQSERQKYGASDPEQINAKRRAIELAKEAANRHTGTASRPPSPLHSDDLSVFIEQYHGNHLIVQAD